MQRFRGRRAAVAGMVVATAGLVQAVTPHGVQASSGCDPVWTDPAGDAYFTLPYQGFPVSVGLYQPQLDMESGTLWQSGSTLVVRVHVADMSTALPPGHTAETWETRWTVGGQSFGTVAVVSAEGTRYFFSGPGGPSSAAGSMVTGPGGYVEVDVPLAALGSPAAGTPVSFDGATAWEWAAVVDESTPTVDERPILSWQGGYGPDLVGDHVDDAPGGGSTAIGATCP